MKEKEENAENPFAAWEVLETRSVFVADPWLSVSVQRLKLPDGKIVDDYYQIHLRESAIIVALADEGKIVFSRQYRHGFLRDSLMLPAGAIDDGEEPLQAARRELLEETGHSSEDWLPLGGYIPLANYGGGKAHVFLAREAVKTAEPISEDLESSEIVLMGEREIVDAIKNRDIICVGTIMSLTLAKTLVDSVFSSSLFLGKV